MNPLQRFQRTKLVGQPKPAPLKPLSHDRACRLLAAMVFAVPPAQAEDFWLKLSDEFQKDVSDFVAKWPPGSRNCYRVAPKSPDDPDSTVVSPL